MTLNIAEILSFEELWFRFFNLLLFKQTTLRVYLLLLIWCLGNRWYLFDDIEVKGHTFWHCIDRELLSLSLLPRRLFRLTHPSHPVLELPHSLPLPSLVLDQLDLALLVRFFQVADHHEAKIYHEAEGEHTDCAQAAIPDHLGV